MLAFLHDVYTRANHSKTAPTFFFGGAAQTARTTEQTLANDHANPESG